MYPTYVISWIANYNIVKTKQEYLKNTIVFVDQNRAVASINIYCKFKMISKLRIGRA